MSDKDKQQSKRQSPLAGSALFTPGAPSVQSLPPVPVQTQTVPSAPDEPPLLYLSEPSAEYLLRPFDRQRDKGAINGNPYLLGAIEAIAKLRKMDKYEVYDEMCLDFIEKYRQLLEHRPDMVRACETRYRQKHNL